MDKEHPFIKEIKKNIQTNKHFSVKKILHIKISEIYEDIFRGKLHVRKY